MNDDDCKSIHAARKIASELGVDPRRSGTARLARPLAAFMNIIQEPLAKVPSAIDERNTLLTGQGFTLVRRAGNLDQRHRRSERPCVRSTTSTAMHPSPVVITVTRELPAMVWPANLSHAATDSAEHEILGPVE